MSRREAQAQAQARDGDPYASYEIPADALPVNVQHSAPSDHPIPMGPSRVCVPSWACAPGSVTPCRRAVPALGEMQRDLRICAAVQPYTDASAHRDKWPYARCEAPT